MKATYKFRRSGWQLSLSCRRKIIQLPANFGNRGNLKFGNISATMSFVRTILSTEKVKKCFVCRFGCHFGCRVTTCN